MGVVVGGVVVGVALGLADCGCRNVITLEKAASSRDIPRLGAGESLTAGVLVAAAGGVPVVSAGVVLLMVPAAAAGAGVAAGVVPKDCAKFCKRCANPL